MTSNILIPTTNILRRVLKIECDGSVGTGVVIFKDGNRFLVTAKHIIESAPDKTRYRQGNIWLPIRPSTINLSENYDLAVLKLPTDEEYPVLQVPDFEIGISAGGIVSGQQVMIVGYPLGFQIERSEHMNNGRPLPLVKVGFLSDVSFKNGRLLIDAHTNKGFSGSPIIFRSPSGSDRNRLSVCGIQTSMYYDEGFAIAVDIGKAIELIDAILKTELGHTDKSLG